LLGQAPTALDNTFCWLTLSTQPQKLQYMSQPADQHSKYQKKLASQSKNQERSQNPNFIQCPSQVNRTLLFVSPKFQNKHHLGFSSHPQQLVMGSRHVPELD
jgi:hypothetical protein